MRVLSVSVIGVSFLGGGLFCGRARFLDSSLSSTVAPGLDPGFTLAWPSPGRTLLIARLGYLIKPFGVLVPRVRLKVRVLSLRARLDVAPIAVEDVLAGVDQTPRMGYCLFIDRVRSHDPYSTRLRRRQLLEA